MIEEKKLLQDMDSKNLFGLADLRDIFFFNEQILLGFKDFVLVFFESGEGLLKLIFIALCVVKDSFAFLRDLSSPTI